MTWFARLLGMPQGVSTHADGIDAVIGAVHAFMFLLFIGWGIFFIYAIVRFRHTNHPKADRSGVKSHFNTYLEGAVLVVELGLLIGLSIPFWSRNVARVPDPSEAVTIRVVAQQFAWNIHYPGLDGAFGPSDAALIDVEANPLGIDRNNVFGADDITTVNQLHVPVGRPIRIELSSYDVIHSFSLPDMRVKQDAIPGMTIPLAFTATETGQWEIACAQLCGIAHYRMRGFITVHTEQDYAAWLTAQDARLQAASQGGSSIFD